MTTTWSSYTSIAPDDMAMKGARASVAMALTLLSQNIPGTASKGSMYTDIVLSFKQHRTNRLTFLKPGDVTSLNWVSIGSGNDFLPVWHHAITWKNADLLSSVPQGTNFSEIWIKIQSISSSTLLLKMLSAKAILFRLQYVKWHWPCG